MYKLYITMTFIRKVKKKSGTYLVEVESYRSKGKVKQRVIKYLGKDVGGVPAKRVLSADIRIKSVKQSLDVLSINAVADKLNITTIKNKYFLALIYSQLLEKRSINQIEDWLRFTEIPEVLGLDNVSTKKLYESLSDMSDEEFNKLNSKMHNIFKRYDKSSDVAVIDVTDTYFEGKKQEIKKRKGKDDKVRRLVQIGLAVSFKYGFPLFHKQYQGNLSNIQIFKDMTLELNKQGLRSVIIDRGMMSNENLQLILGLRLKLIAGMRKTKSLNDNFLSKINREEIYSLRNRVKLKNTSVFIQSFDYFKGKLIAVYNPSLEVIKNELNFEKGNQQRNSYVGYSLIYHNTKYPDEEIVKKYYDKEIVERAFKQLKGILNLRPIRVWLKEHIQGHIKICYLAYAILSFINYKLRKMDITAIDALNSLRYGYKVNLYADKDNFEWSLFVPLEPKQKKMLRALGVVYKN